MTGLDRFTTDLPTPGGPVNIEIRNIGYGRHVLSMAVNMSYANFEYSYIADDCRVAWNGSMVSCIAVPGVSRSLRWTMSIHGFPGILSAPSVVLNYKPPVIYDIFSLHNRTLTSPSAGGEIFNVTGVNFGPASVDAIVWMHYSPEAHPAVIFDAYCTILVDHYVLECVTGAQAGGGLYWTVNVAGQISQIPFTATRYPNITSVSVLQLGEWLRTFPNGTVYGAVPIRSIRNRAAANVSLGLSTSGGGIILLRGTYVGLICF